LGSTSRKVEQMVGFSLGGPEVLIIVGVLVLLFGAKKLPELARSVGKSTSEFKKGIAEGESEAEPAPTSDEDETEKKADHKAETTE
jgi:sec-independent protein translocase protein TatA